MINNKKLETTRELLSNEEFSKKCYELIEYLKREKKIVALILYGTIKEERRQFIRGENLWTDLDLFPISNNSNYGIERIEDEQIKQISEELGFTYFINPLSKLETMANEQQNPFVNAALRAGKVIHLDEGLNLPELTGNYTPSQITAQFSAQGIRNQKNYLQENINKGELIQNGFLFQELYRLGKHILRISLHQNNKKDYPFNSNDLLRITKEINPKANKITTDLRTELIASSKEEEHELRKFEKSNSLIKKINELYTALINTLLLTKNSLPKD